MTSNKTKFPHGFKRENCVITTIKVIAVMIIFFLVGSAVFSIYFFGTEGTDWDRGQVIPENKMFEVPLSNGTLKLSSCHFLKKKGGAVYIRALGPTINIKAEMDSPLDSPIRLVITNIQAHNCRITPDMPVSILSPTSLEMEWMPAPADNSIRLSWDRPDLMEYMFFVCGDTHYGWIRKKGILEKIIRAAKRENPEFIVILGDITASGNNHQYRGLADLLRKSPVPVFTVCGNHDIQGGGRILYQEYFGPLFYSTDFANTHLVFLDSSTGLLYPDEEKWIKRDAAGDKKALIFSHIPPYDPRPWGYHQAINEKESKRMVSLFQEYQSPVVFCGHVHSHYRYKVQGIPVIISGGGGAPLIGNPERHGFYHYSRVTVNRDGNIGVEPVRVSDTGAYFIVRLLNVVMEPISYFFNKHPVILILVLLVFLGGIVWAILRKS